MKATDYMTPILPTRSKLNLAKPLDNMYARDWNYTDPDDGFGTQTVELYELSKGCGFPRRLVLVATCAPLENSIVGIEKPFRHDQTYAFIGRGRLLAVINLNHAQFVSEEINNRFGKTSFPLYVYK